MANKKGVMSFLNRKKDDNVKKSDSDGKHVGHGFLSTITPRKGYGFYSDYFEIDYGYGTIVTMFNNTGSDDNLPAMWGINLIPHNLGKRVVSRLIQHVETAKPEWVEDHQSKADDLNETQSADANKSGRTRDVLRSRQRQRDILDINQEITAGDAYHHVDFKVYLKAPTIKELDLALERMQRSYNMVFSKVYFSAFDGKMKEDFSKLLKPASQQIGKNYMMTSTELAGAYNIVTHGIEDPGGEYVGQLRADVNNTAILWDIDKYKHHIVVATDNEAATLSDLDFGDEKSSTMWGVKLSQEALMHNHRVVHLVLNNANVSDIGVDLDDITANISLADGDINPFEMFGEYRDELSIFPTNLEKIRLMTKQLNPQIDQIGLNTLSDQLTKFYIDSEMWVENAQNNRKKIRVVNIPHKDVPKLQMFVTYLDTAYKKMISSKNQDHDLLRSLTMLRGLYHDMLTSNGDLFNVITTHKVDDVKNMPRVIYDFSSLMLRGKGVAMAQFINALGYATSTLQAGDVVILHGAELLDSNVIEYVNQVFDSLLQKDIRIAYIYDSVDAMLDDTAFNKLPTADYVLTGYMSTPTVEKYQERIGVAIPKSLSSAIVSKNDRLYYLRRDFDNIIFENDLVLS